MLAFWTYLLIGISIVCLMMRVFLDFLDYMRFYRDEVEQEENTGKEDASC